MKPKTHKKKDKRAAMIRIVCLALCIVIVGGLVTSALVSLVSAATSAEIRKELDALKSQANEIAAQGAALEESMAANRSETQTTIEKKMEIDQRISLTEAEIRNTNAQIQQYNLLVAAKQSELEQSEAKMDAMNEKYKARLRSMEESGDVSYWAILFRANDFSDLLGRIDSINEIAYADTKMLEEMKGLSAQIEEERQELEAEVQALQTLRDDLAVMEADLQSQREEADALLLELADAYENLSDEYLANAAREEELQAQMIQTQLEYEKAKTKEREAELAALAKQNQNNAAGGGGSAGGGSSSSGFTPPLGYINVTCAFGPRIHPLWGTKSNHTGVDLAANQGTPIYAIASGTVTAAGYNDAYGYNVTLAHGNGYGSMYAHMTHFTVSVGQPVKQGEIIGYVGSTGWSTGPHLHFEIYVGGAPVNPMLYIG